MTFYYIYTKDNCRYCDKAKDFLNLRNTFFVQNCLNNFDCIQQLKNQTNHCTFPFVFKRITETNSSPLETPQNYQFIGGYTDLLDHMNTYEFTEDF